MKTKIMASALALLAAATLLVAEGAHARRFGGNHHGGAHTGGFHYRVRWGWGAAAAAGVDAKAAARARYDAHDYDFLHRCYEPQRIWNGAYYKWHLVSIC